MEKVSTSLNLDDDVHDALKARAIAEDRSASYVANALLRLALFPPAAVRRHETDRIRRARA